MSSVGTIGGGLHGFEVCTGGSRGGDVCWCDLLFIRRGPTGEGCGGEIISLKVKEKRILALHNVARAAHGLKPLCADPRLTRAARSHSREMIKKDYFSHSSYNGENVGKRLRRFGYHRSIYAENIAGGSGTFGKSGSTFRRWINSPSHKGNILDRRFRPVGVGTYSGRYKGTWKYTMYTVDFGVRG